MRHDLVRHCRATYQRNPNLLGSLRDLLARTLGAEIAIRRAHWEVTGPSFQGLHLLFDDAYKAAAAWSDLVAERIRQLGGSVEGVDPASEPAIVHTPDAPGRMQATRVEQALASVIAAADAAVVPAEDDRDQATIDVLAEILRAADKLRWFVRSHLEPTGLRFNGRTRVWRNPNSVALDDEQCSGCGVIIPAGYDAWLSDRFGGWFCSKACERSLWAPFYVEKRRTPAIPLEIPTFDVDLDEGVANPFVPSVAWTHRRIGACPSCGAGLKQGRSSCWRCGTGVSWR